MDKLQEAFERFYYEFSGQTLTWIKRQRDNRRSEPAYVIGSGIQAYWIMFKAGWEESRKAAIESLPPLRVIPESARNFPDECDWPDGHNTAVEEIRKRLTDGWLKATQKHREGSSDQS